MTPDEHGIDRIRRLAGQAGRRMRLVRAVGIAPRAVSAALVVALVAVGLRKLGIAGEGAARVAVVTSAALAAGAVVVAWLWPLPERDAARVLDRFHSLHDRLSSALAFASLPKGPQRTPFMEAAIADAVVAAAGVRPREAVRLRLPPGLGPAALLGGALVAL
ncbi:MAG: hypothetical protein ACRENE_04515, partial [Polyangiaceae bacterium]